MKAVARALYVTPLLAALMPAAHAVENGSPITPFGVYDFSAGMLPPPSEVGTFGVRTTFYRAKELRDANGDVSPVGANLKADSIGLAFIKMTGITLGSAKFGWGAVVPALDMKLDLSVPTPVGPLALSGSNSALGDVQLIPAILQWTPSPGVYTNFQLIVQAPTGAYDKNRLINAGTNHWTLVPTVALTWIHPSGFELSTNAQLNFNARNKDTDYKSGVEYQQEFAAGQHVGPWTIGLGGYVYRQISDDTAPGLTNGNRARVNALGPAINFFDLGSGWPVVWIHGYKEFGARNRSQGQQLAVRAAWTF
jgi:hypothetical protein